MKKDRTVRIVKLVLFGVAAVAVFGVVVMSLWNWLAPAIFGLKTIGFWQAVGLVVLCRILFGGFRGEGRHPASDRRRRLRLIERWEKMTPEERHAFREGLRKGCEPEPPPPGEPT
jgi:hypothetical protein